MTRYTCLIALLPALVGCKEPPVTAEAIAAMAANDPAVPAKRKPVELTWFKGAAELPPEHPCHDSTKVVVFTDEPNVPTATSVSTLGDLRKDPDTRWVHFGPRAVQGVRWSSPAGDFLVVSCAMGGSGYRAYDPTRDKAYLSARPTFALGDVGEPSHIEYAEVRWMHRAPGHGWTTMREDVLWGGDDEGNDPQNTTWAAVLGAIDADGDGMPEITALTVRDCHHAEKHCPDSDARTPSFWVDLIATEGKLGLQEAVLLGPDLAEVTAEPELHAALPPEVHAQLSTAIAGMRTEALNRARAVLRDASKLPR